MIELEVERVFDTLDKAQLRAVVRRRVRDGGLLRLIGKWLNAGVLEEGATWYPEAGPPQGGVRSPRLATLLLHDVRDVWVERRGSWVIKPQTATDRLSRAISRIGRWCREHRHAPVSEQRRERAQKLRGHDGYYGITGNAQRLGRFLNEVKRRWRYWLNRRSDRRRWTGERCAQFSRTCPLPPPIPVHSILRHAAKP